MTYDVFPIERQVELAPGIFQIDFYTQEIAEKVKPGQFVNVYANNPTTLLPRPISVYDADPKNGRLSLIYAVVGKGTKEFSMYEEGETLRLTGPLGNGFPLEEATEAEEVLLIGGGLGIPPMQFAGKMLHEMYPEITITSILGFRSVPWIQETFDAFGTVLCASDDGACGFKGNVIDRLEDYLSEQPNRRRILFACGPIPMMKAIQAWPKTNEVETWFSLEERMGCGFGACYGCPVRILQGEKAALKRVCKDGPVFRGKDVIFS